MLHYGIPWDRVLYPLNWDNFEVQYENKQCCSIIKYKYKQPWQLS